MAKKRKAPAGTEKAVPAKNGPADMEWELLSGADLSRPGALLINLLLAAAEDRHITVGKLTEILKVSGPYFYALKNGKNDISKVNDEFVERAARFLGMPNAAAKLVAGKLKPEDFYSEPDRVRDTLMPALRFMYSDRDWVGFIPASIMNADPAIQLCVIMLYERATKHTLIPGRVSPEEILKRHRVLMQV